jgi:small subunit ribosomal protein S4
MKIGSRYKIARRLGSHIYDKTSTVKYTQRAQQREGSKPRPKSDFGVQMLEKQKARFTYGVMERQFKKYVNEALAQKATKAEINLYARLETRLDNVIYRLGLANSRAFARQMVSHGHIMLNGTRVTIPSINVSVGDKIEVRAESLKRNLLKNMEGKLGEAKVPTWLTFDMSKKAGQVNAIPTFSQTDVMFDMQAILEFYRR